MSILTYQKYAPDFPSFKSLQMRIDSLTKAVEKLGFSVNYFIQKFEVDADYYRYWLTGDLRDFAEFVILYLPEQVKAAIEKDAAELAQICA